MVLDPREKRLLSALSERSWTTADSLSQELNMSPRTIRSMVKALRAKLDGHGARIASKTHHGYMLQVTDREAYDRFHDTQLTSIEATPSDIEERTRYLAYSLLIWDKWNKIDDLAESLYLSRWTVTSDLKIAQRVFEQFDLVVRRRPSYGIRVEGAESDIRACAAHILTEYNSVLTHLGENERQTFQLVSQLIQEMGEEFDLHFPEISFRNLVNRTYVGVLRLSQGCHLSESAALGENEEEIGPENALSPSNLPSQTADDIPLHSQEAASWLVTRLEAQFGITYPPQEADSLAIDIAGKRNYGGANDESENIVIPVRLMKLVESMLDSVYSSFKLDYRNNFPLRMSLGQHLVPLTFACDTTWQ